VSDIIFDLSRKSVQINMNNTGNGKNIKRSAVKQKKRVLKNPGGGLGFKKTVRAYRTHPTPDAQFQ